MVALNEIWKDIKGYEGFYQVSNLGKIKSLDRNIIIKNGRHRFFKGRLLQLNYDIDGYFMVCLCMPGKTQFSCNVHKLVAKAFVEGYKEGLVVNHKDGNKENNVSTNLEWVTVAENNKHAIDTGLLNPHKSKPQNSYKGENHPMSKLLEQDVKEIRKMALEGIPHKEIAKKFGICKERVCAIKKGRVWKHILDESIIYPKLQYHRGERNSNSKLTEKDVFQIRKLLADNILNIKQIALQFNVSSTTISYIKLGKSWSYLK
jgi:hypothetical protein